MFFLQIFTIPSSSRHEKCCQMLRSKEILEKRHGEPIKFLFLPKMGLLESQAGNEKKFWLWISYFYDQKFLIIHNQQFLSLPAWLPKRPILCRNRNFIGSPCLFSTISLVLICIMCLGLMLVPHSWRWRKGYPGAQPAPIGLLNKGQERSIGNKGWPSTICWKLYKNIGVIKGHPR